MPDEALGVTAAPARGRRPLGEADEHGLIVMTPQRPLKEVYTRDRARAMTKNALQHNAHSLGNLDVSRSARTQFMQQYGEARPGWSFFRFPIERARMPVRLRVLHRYGFFGDPTVSGRTKVYRGSSLRPERKRKRADAVFFIDDILAITKTSQSAPRYDRRGGRAVVAQIALTCSAKSLST